MGKAKMFWILMLHVVLAESSVVEVEELVEVNEGFLMGEQKTLITGEGIYYSFMGIPYAEPPVGNLRFRDPIKAKHWEGIRNATTEPPSCLQPDKFNVTHASEDCLYLNVYTPSVNTTRLLPVIFFIHGGHFRYGSGNFNNYGPDFLVDKDVVVVTINYRLGPLGFLCLDIPEVPGNAGLKDQVLALRWVRDNIKVFGGDKNRITLFGNGVGAWSVGVFMLSPGLKYLFKRAILSSGNPIMEYANNIAPIERAIKLAKMFGCSSLNRIDMFDVLQNVSAKDLVNAKAHVLTLDWFLQNSKISRTAWPPVNEKEFGQERILPENIYVSYYSGIVQDAIMIGHTDIESLAAAEYFEEFKYVYNNFREYLVPYQILTDRTPEDVLDVADDIYLNYFHYAPTITNDTISDMSTFISDFVFNDSWQRFIQRLYGVNVYAYLFSCVSERNKYLEFAQQYGLRGAGHTEDLDYIFNPNYRNLVLNTDSKSYKMIHQTTTLITNFAKYGNPTPNAKSSFGITWQQYNGNQKSYLNINENLTMNTYLDNKLHDFWIYMYGFAGLEY